MYPVLGDKDALDGIRKKFLNGHHCTWLKRDSNACEVLPSGVEGELDGVKILPGMVCPHNVYYHQHKVFANRDGVADTVERIFRLVSMSELKLLNERDLDVTSISELIAARSELDKQSSDRQNRERENARMESQVNQRGV